jgi:hypothetical protein
MPEPTIENKIKHVLFEHQLIERISDIKLKMCELMIDILTIRPNHHVILYDGIVKDILKYDIRNYRMCDENNFDEIRRKWMRRNPEYFTYTFNSVQYLMALMLFEEDNDD